MVVSKEDLKIIKEAADGIADPTQDRRDHLNTLFEMHSKYYNKSWSKSSQSCGKCVQTVKKGIEDIINSNHGE